MWVKEPPKTPGRYYWRDPESLDYGVCLLAWTKPLVVSGRVYPPRLGYLTFIIWGTNDETWNPHKGELSDHPQWSYTSRLDTSALEFWSEPIFTPPGFPEIPVDEPEPPDPQDVESSRAEVDRQKKEQDRITKVQLKRKKQAVKKAVKAGRTVYLCESCDGIFYDSELVTVKMRTCGNCETEFFEQDGDRACPICNRPFTRLEDEFEGCPMCQGESGEPELICLVKDGVEQNESS